MIQSDLRGGSLHASRAALSYGRWLAIPYPTEQDRARREPKIQANLMLADGTSADRRDLLRLKDDAALDRVLVWRSKEDYARCLIADDQQRHGPQGTQDSMF